MSKDSSDGDQSHVTKLQSSLGVEKGKITTPRPRVRPISASVDENLPEAPLSVAEILQREGLPAGAPKRRALTGDPGDGHHSSRR